ncbi:MAG TPA: hypothetical protein EYG80_03745 [Flavobacteriaceae bacterium]|nr:hypothetical protein [Flavobacteriaceae bacterium]
MEYNDIDAFIIGSDIAEEVSANIENKNIFLDELLDFEKSKSRFCLLVDRKINIDENKKLSQQFDFLITKYPKLAKKYI